MQCHVVSQTAADSPPVYSGVAIRVRFDAAGSPGFNPVWKNYEPGCKLSPKVQPRSFYLRRLNLLPQNPTSA